MRVAVVMAAARAVGKGEAVWEAAVAAVVWGHTLAATEAAAKQAASSVAAEIRTPSGSAAVMAAPA